jgi:RNA polymerase sigma-70 factor (ECF subfamily)
MSPPADRDETWFTRVYTAQYPSVVNYALRRLADPDASAELAQEVFVIAWRRRAEVPDHSLPWLYGVARRLLANQYRARRTAPELLPITEAAGTGGADESVAVADVRAALATLSERDQEILRLIGWEELSVSEAAQVLGCTRTTAAVRLHRARKRLMAAMSTRPVPALHSTRKEP